MVMLLTYCNNAQHYGTEVHLADDDANWSKELVPVRGRQLAYEQAQGQEVGVDDAKGYVVHSNQEVAFVDQDKKKNPQARDPEEENARVPWQGTVERKEPDQP